MPTNYRARPLMLAVAAGATLGSVLAATGSIAASKFEDCSRSIDTVTHAECLNRNLRAAELLLEETLQVVFVQLPAAAAGGFAHQASTDLRASQRSWREHRDAECSAKSALTSPGTASGLVFTQCQVMFTQARIQLLMRWLELEQPIISTGPQNQ